MIIPRIVPKVNLVTANSLMLIQFDLALVVGPIIGGYLAHSHLSSFAFTGNASSFFLASLLLFSLSLLLYIKEIALKIRLNNEFNHGIKN